MVVAGIVYVSQLLEVMTRLALASVVRMVEVLVTKTGGTVEQEAVTASTRVVLCLDMEVV